MSSCFAASRPVEPPVLKGFIAWGLQKNHGSGTLAFRKDIFSYKEPGYWFTIVSNRASRTGGGAANQSSPYLKEDTDA